MPIQLLDRIAPVSSPEELAPTPARRPRPDAGYDALPRLARLAADLMIAAAPQAASRWKEPPVFFFERRRQVEYEAARPPIPQPDPFAELSTRIAAELPGLCDSVTIRQVARGVAGLRPAAAALASRCPAAKDLAELLAIPDDEVITVLHPAMRFGFRMIVRGIADIGQFHILLAEAMSDAEAGPMVPARFVAACRDADPTAAAGVPMIAEARFLMYKTAALRSDGSLPAGFGGSDHWLWPNMPLANVPRIDGERVVLLGAPAYRQTFEVSRRFPALAAELQMLESLNPFRTAERLSKITGKPVSPAVQREPEMTLAKAA
jgi:hypothetical protein